MELIVHSHQSPIDESQGYMPPLPDEYKFIVIQSHKGVVTEVGPSDIMGAHSDAARSLLTEHSGEFLGAGYVKPYLNTIRYDSDTCTESYGRDRPEDKTEAELLLAEIRTELEKVQLLNIEG